MLPFQVVYIPAFKVNITNATEGMIDLPARDIIFTFSQFQRRQHYPSQDKQVSVSPSWQQAKWFGSAGMGLGGACNEQLGQVPGGEWSHNSSI
jgi:hypothetical protein